MKAKEEQNHTCPSIFRDLAMCKNEIRTYPYEPKKAEEIDLSVYPLEFETSEYGVPQIDTYDNVACFRNKATAREHSDWILVLELGRVEKSWSNACHWNMGWPSWN